jgi:hypothetical protein
MERGFAAQYVAYRLAHALSRRGYGVSVTLVGGDEGEAQARRSQMRVV